MDVEQPESLELDEGKQLPAIDAARARFPYCLVWTPLPVVAWLVPFVGHVGVCDAHGVIFDFAGPYFVNVDNFAFGSTARYIRLHPGKGCYGKTLPEHRCKDGYRHQLLERSSSWDEALRASMRHFQHRSYNIFTCNCHCFLVNFLNILAYEGRTNWNVVDVVWLFVSRGKWVNTYGVLKSVIPTLVVMSIGYYLVGATFLLGWLIFSCLLIGWFLIGTYVFPSLIEI